jgi:C-terminal processing protease CtpA/Prc
MKSQNSLRKFIFLVLITLVGSTFIASSKNDKAAITRNLDIFNSVYKELQVFYVDSIDAEKSINTAINAMLNNIDPYTEYIPAKEYNNFCHRMVLFGRDTCSARNPKCNDCPLRSECNTAKSK